mgnify:CR=1 FL=1
MLPGSQAFSLSGGLTAEKGANCMSATGGVTRRFFCGMEQKTLASTKIGRCMDIALDLMINEEIRDREVRLIDENGEQLGVMPTAKAMELAEERGLDLAKIQPTAKPPVCKLLDYDKYRYEQSRRERENRKNQRVVETKEVQLSATIEEWLMSAEYIMAGGNEQVILCERGIRTFETYTRNTLDLSAICAVKKLSHLPVIVDPSHSTGKNWMVQPIARAAIAVGADGVMIEVHNDPAHALCDGAQSITPAAFVDVMADIRKIAEAVGREV